MERSSREGSYPALARELNQMFVIDQAVRRSGSVAEDRKIWTDEMRKMDAAHTARMKAIVALYG